MSDRQIIYEPHPVSQERKEELRALGYTIIDARFKPTDDAIEAKPIVVEEQTEAPARRTRGQKAK